MKYHRTSMKNEECRGGKGISQRHLVAAAATVVDIVVDVVVVVVVVVVVDSGVADQLGGCVIS